MMYVLRVLGIRGEPLTLILSNLTSLFLLAISFLLSRGSDATRFPIDTILMFLVVGVGVVAADSFYYYAGQITANPSTAYWRLWSVALAVMAPILMGRAFRTRYATNSVLIIAVIYSMMQPIAYGSMFFRDDPSHAPVTLYCADDIQAAPLVRAGVLKPAGHDGMSCGLGTSNYQIACSLKEITIDQAHELMVSLRGDQSNSLDISMKLLGPSIILHILALLKIALGACVLMHLQRLSPDSRPTIRIAPREKNWVSLLAESPIKYHILGRSRAIATWKFYVWGQFLVAATIMFLFGKRIVLAARSVSVILLAALVYLLVVVVLILSTQVLKKGRTFSDFLRELRKS